MTKPFPTDIIVFVSETYLQAQKQADMAELADAPDLGSGVPDVQVQVLLSAAYKDNYFDTMGIKAIVLTFCPKSLKIADFLTLSRKASCQSNYFVLEHFLRFVR